ncbi:MAG: hypothetical protein JNM81_13710 [Rhodospirillaceae bacterium]|nr:hypothetical protein [Rhodospirillaceae bacterium]
MAIDNYNKLQAALADTINRDDLSADVTAFSPAQIDGAIKRAIAYAEKAIQRDIVSRGGIKHMETVKNTLATTAGQETLTLPTDFLGVRVLAITADPMRVLEFVDPNTLFIQYPSAATGAPEKYTLVGANTAYLRPVPDRAYPLRLIYTAALPALSVEQATNWLLLNAPDLYIGAAMLELCIYLENDDRLQFWKMYYDERMTALLGDDKNARWSAVPVKPSVQVALA